MVKEARSKGACWTCRLRRKKCDEVVPKCLACTSHSLPCYGYERPSWADGGGQQKEKYDELRVVIREVASSRRHQLKDRSSRSPVKIILGKDPTADDLGRKEETQPPYISLPSQFIGTFTDVKEIMDIPVPYLNSTFTPQNHDSQEALLMHYIDVVFPTQFPLSKGYGNTHEWLLPLILQVKPLYHVAISLAAHHQEFLAPGAGASSTGVLHYTLAIKELRKYLAECHGFNLLVCLKSNVEVLASIMLLISLGVSVSRVSLIPMLADQGHLG